MGDVEWLNQFLFIFFLWLAVRRGSVAPAAHHCPLVSDFCSTNAFFSPFFFLDLGRESDSGKKLNPHPRYFRHPREPFFYGCFAPIRAPSRHSDKVKKRQKNKSTREEISALTQLVWVGL